MAFATLTVFTTSSSISFGILLIPDLRMNRCMSLLRISVCCKNSLMGTRGKYISWSLTLSTWAGVLAVNFGRYGPCCGCPHCLSKFLRQTCNNVPIGDLSGYSLKLPLDIAGKICTYLPTASHDLEPSLPPKCPKAIHFRVSRSSSWQEICSGTQKEGFFPRKKIRFKSVIGVASGFIVRATNV